MNAEEKDWRETAFEVYRLAWSELLDKCKGPQPDNVEFYVEELKEALLDLKEATMTEDVPRAMRHIEEVMVLLAELRLRLRGD